jgi:hypothetical protein
MDSAFSPLLVQLCLAITCQPLAFTRSIITVNSGWSVCRPLFAHRRRLRRPQDTLLFLQGGKFTPGKPPPFGIRSTPSPSEPSRFVDVSMRNALPVLPRCLALHVSLVWSRSSSNVSPSTRGRDVIGEIWQRPCLPCLCSMFDGLPWFVPPSHAGR